VSSEDITPRRDWDLARDGDLDGRYVELRKVVVKNGPSAGQVKLVLDLHVGLNDELVSLFPGTVALRQLREELERRAAADFEPGERIKIARGEKRQGVNGSYWVDQIWFEHAAPKPSAADLLRVEEQADFASGEPQLLLEGGSEDETPF
jgi:hypothetical protein